ncbi:MAG TPA: hypothetical protein VGO89_03890, partial [Streptomyces sp.]|nr:hypothetical protein [Streptomyces sp.]
LKDPAPQRDFSLASADGQTGDPISLFSAPLSKDSGLPDACSKGAPESLAPGRKATVCQIVMMPKNRTPTAVSYTGRDAKGNESDPVIWKAGGGGDELPSGVLPPKKTAESAVDDTKGRSVKVRATPESVRAGKAADLRRFNLRPEQKKKVPYYVTVEYRNVGSYALLPSMNEQVELYGTSGQQAQRLTLIDFGGKGVSQCPDAVPDEMLKPKASVKECSIHLLSRTDPPAAFSFAGEGASAKSITWQATEGEK